ncbi:MAG: Ig-like domain repeat protein [Nakamurella sp.]
MGRRTRGVRSLLTVMGVAALALTAACGPGNVDAGPSVPARTVPAQTVPTILTTMLTLHAADTSISFGSGVQVAFALEAADGTVPPSATAVVRLDTTPVNRRVAMGPGGTASVELDAADLPPGPHVVSVDYLGDSAFAAATGTATITVMPAASAVALTLTPLADGTTTAAAAVTTLTGVPAAGAVEFTVDGAPIGGAALTDGSGALQIPAGLTLGAHAVAANFTPDAADQIAAGSGAGTLTINKTATAVLATGRADALRYGDHSGFTVSVIPTGAPADLTGAVTVSTGGTTVAEGATDATGAALLDFYNTVDPGTQNYTVSYAGNDMVEPARSDFTVTTTPTTVDISITKPTLKPGDSGTVTVSVIGTPQMPTGTATVTFDGAVVAEAALNGDGKITAPVSAVSVGSHTVKVSYSGDVRFEAGSASNTLTVKAPVVNPNSDGGAAINADNPCPATAQACVDLSQQRAWLQAGGEVTYGPVSITSGRSGYRTPAGTFSAYWFDKDHRSSIYDDAPMPNSVFFNRDIAFHQGSLSQQSHGCIHLSGGASSTFFDALAVGDTVYVWGSAPY